MDLNGVVVVVGVGCVNKHNLLQMQECTVTHSHLNRKAGQVHNLAHVAFVSNPYCAAPPPQLGPNDDIPNTKSQKLKRVF